MKTQHTPGPWTIHADTDGWPLVMSGGVAGRIVANVNPQSCPDESSAPEFVEMPCEANARLIAAAPELLDALQWLVDLMPDPELDSDPVQREQVIKAKVAIAKATGGKA